MKAFSHFLWFTVELKPAVAALYQIFVHFLFQLVVLWLKTLIFSILLHFWNNPSSSFSLMPPATCHYITAQFAANQVLLLRRLIYSHRNSGTSPVSQNNISFSCVINSVVARALISLSVVDRDTNRPSVWWSITHYMLNADVQPEERGGSDGRQLDLWVLGGWWSASHLSCLTSSFSNCAANTRGKLNQWIEATGCILSLSPRWIYVGISILAWTLWCAHGPPLHTQPLTSPHRWSDDG